MSHHMTRLNISGLITGATVVILAVIALRLWSGTGTADSATINGWPIGDVYSCVDDDPQQPCSVFVPLAEARLDEREPGHPTAVASELRLERNQVRTTVLFVALFTLVDGSKRAVGVMYPGVATTPLTIDYGP